MRRWRWYRDGRIAGNSSQAETLEEFGYAVGSLNFIGKFYVTPGGSSERIFLFGAEIRSAGKVAEGGGMAAEDEDIRLVEFPLANLDRLLGEVEDAKTLVGLYWLKHHLQAASSDT